MVHIRQPMHLAFSYATRVVPSARCMAPVGHTFVHDASSHCWHIIGTEKPCRSQVYTWTRAAVGRNCPSCPNSHARLQFRHPVHLSGWIIRIFAMSVLRVRAGARPARSQTDRTLAPPGATGGALAARLAWFVEAAPNRLRANALRAAAAAARDMSQAERARPPAGRGSSAHPPLATGPSLADPIV